MYHPSPAPAPALIDEELSSFVKTQTRKSTVKLSIGFLGRQSKTKTTSKLFVLVIGTLVTLVAFPLLNLHSVLTTFNLQSSSTQEENENDGSLDLESIMHDVALLAASNHDSPKPDQRADESTIVWEVIPTMKDSAGSHLKPATICACAKCGSSSFWRELFAIVHGRSFASMNYTGPPWIHNMSNKKLWTNIQAKRKTDWSSFEKQDSFALIRDPKERILSAFKSKVRCDTHADIDGHRRLVPFLLNLAGSNITARVDSDSGFPCLDLSDYLSVLLQVHTQGKEGFLDTHFLPQHLGCFKYAPPSMWTVVTSISDPNARCSLKSVVTRSTDASKVDNDCEMTKSHGTSSEPLTLTVEDEVILDKITSKEYDILAQYLAA